MTEPSQVWATSITSDRPVLDNALEITPGTLPGLLQDCVRKRPDHVQYRLPDESTYTVKQFYDFSVRVGKALVATGVQPLQAVCIQCASCIEWCATDFGAGLAAAVGAAVHQASTAETVAHVTKLSGAVIFFVDSEEGLDKFLSVKNDCPNVTNLVCWGPYDAEKYASYPGFVRPWDAFLRLGDQVTDEQIAERMATPKPSSVCKLMFTSGTTGMPKGAMLSQDNMSFTCQLMEGVLGVSRRDRIISFLPPSHIGPEIMGALFGCTFAFFDADTRGGSVVDALRKTRPTMALVVPRTCEKLMEHLLAEEANGNNIEAAAARNSGGGDMPGKYHLAKMAVLKDLKKDLGLDRCRLFMNTGGPIQQATAAYLARYDLQVLNMYGMSEATGPLVFNHHENKAGTAGKVIKNMEVMVRDENEIGEGELCFRGRNIFVGYVENEEETRQKIDDDGFIRSGDLGHVDEDGFVTISGRAKELIVLATGRNIAPLPIESALVSSMPAISRAFVLGEGRKFISTVLIPYMDGQGNLMGPAAAVNPSVGTVAEAKGDEIWAKYLSEGVADANRSGANRAGSCAYTEVQRFELLERDFSVEAGELTPTMKLKRKVVEQNLVATVARLYADVRPAYHM